MSSSARSSSKDQNGSLHEPLQGPQPEQAMAGRTGIIMNVCVFILVMELAERLCFYTFSGSIVIFIRDNLGYSQSQASAMGAAFNTLVYLTPLIGGYVADAWWGRYRTIFVFGMLYFTGVGLMTLAAYPPRLTKWLFMLSFFGLVSMGAGGIKANVISFGADQFDIRIPIESAQKDTYFIYFYWVINVGALVSYFVLAQMATEPTEFGLKDGYGFFYTFLIATAALGLALVSFFSATARYKFRPPSGSAPVKYAMTVYRASSTSTEGKLLVSGVGVTCISIVSGIAQPFITTSKAIQDSLSYLAFASSVVGIALILIPTTKLPTWLEHDRTAMYTTRVVSVLFNSVSFQVVYAAMSYFFLSACQMDVNIAFSNGKLFQINATMLNAADCIAIIIVVPFLDSIIYPFIERVLGRKAKATEKYMAGMFVSVLAIISAAWLEVARRERGYVKGCGSHHHSAPLSPTPAPTSVDDDQFYADNDECYSQCAATGVQMSNFPVWYMAIPFFLVGTAECLCNIPIYDLCYSQTPPAYRSLAQAIFLFTTAVGSMLTGAFTTALSHYLPDDLNDGHLEYFYYLCLIFVLLFIPVNLLCFSYFDELDEHFIESLTETDSESMLADDAPPSTSENGRTSASSNHQQLRVDPNAVSGAGTTLSGGSSLSGKRSSLARYGRYSYGGNVSM